MAGQGPRREQQSPLSPLSPLSPQGPTFPLQSTVLQGIRFDLPADLLAGGGAALVGMGGHGHVCACGQAAAVKMVSDIFHPPSRLRRAVTEVAVLQALTAAGREAAAALLAPPPAVRLQRTYVAGHCLYLVLERMPCDLFQLLHQHREGGASGSGSASDSYRLLPSDMLGNLAAGLLAALAYLHGSGLAHGDIKPSNVLVDPEQSPPRVKLCDFGSAASLQAPAPVAPDPAAPPPTTLWYRAPEMLRGGQQRASAAADIWAAGCVLGEMASGGRPLFPGRDHEHMQVLVLGSGDAAAGAEPTIMPAGEGLAGAAFDRALWQLVPRLLRLDQAARPSATESLALLESVQACQAPPGTRAVLPAVHTPVEWSRILPTGAEDERELRAWLARLAEHEPQTSGSPHGSFSSPAQAHAQIHAQPHPHPRSRSHSHSHPHPHPHPHAHPHESPTSLHYTPPHLRVPARQSQTSSPQLSSHSLLASAAGDGAYDSDSDAGYHLNTSFD